MNTIQNTITQIPIRADYQWQSLVVEKRASKALLNKLYKQSILSEFITLFSSHVN
jgi:hypothetical protein